MPTCFFLGHRDCAETVVPALSQAVLAAKARHPQVRLTLLLPYHPAARPQALPPGFDGSFYPPGQQSVPPRLAIVRAGRYMLAHSTHLIACIGYPSAARSLWQAALARQRRGELRVTNLCP